MPRKSNPWTSFQKKHSGKGLSRAKMKQLYKKQQSKKRKSSKKGSKRRSHRTVEFGTPHPLTPLERDTILRTLQKYNIQRYQRRHAKYGARLLPSYEVIGPPLNMYTNTPWST